MDKLLTMKKAFLVAAILISLTARGQKKDSTIVKDTSVHLFVLVMPSANWQQLIALIKTSDEKPSIIKAWVEFITINARELSEPKKTK